MKQPPPTDEPRRGARPAPSRSPALFGLALVLLVLCGAGLAFYLTNRAKTVQAEPKAEASVNPFADLPPEAPPEKQAKSKAELQREQWAQDQATPPK